MCGIIGAFNGLNDKNNGEVNDWVIKQLEDQFSRGSKGFGIIFIDDKLNVNIERATEMTKVLFDMHLNKSKMIILHHRQPTSTPNKLKQTHPIFVSNKELKHDYYIIHNGVITRDEELKETHEDLGYKYTTAIKEKEETKFNDSECLAIEAARYIEGKSDIVDIENSGAFIALQTDKKTKKAIAVYYSRIEINNYGGWLNMTKTRDKIRISSEGPGKEVTENTLFHFKLNDPKLEIKKNALILKPKEEEKEDSKEVGFTANQTTKALESEKDETCSEEQEQIETIIENFFFDLDTAIDEINTPKEKRRMTFEVLLEIKELLSDAIQKAEDKRKTELLTEPIGGKNKWEDGWSRRSSSLHNYRDTKTSSVAKTSHYEEDYDEAYPSVYD